MRSFGNRSRWPRLNQSPAVASAGPFIEVRHPDVRRQRTRCRDRLAARPLDRLFAEPSRRYLEAARTRQCAAALAARLAVEGDRAVGVDLRGERIAAGAVVSSVPWFAFAALAGHVPALEPIASGRPRAWRPRRSSP